MPSHIKATSRTVKTNDGCPFSAAKPSTGAAEKEGPKVSQLVGPPADALNKKKETGHASKHLGPEYATNTARPPNSASHYFHNNGDNTDDLFKCGFYSNDDNNGDDKDEAQPREAVQKHITWDDAKRNGG